MERLTDKKEADAQRQEYEKRLKNGYLRNIPEERFLKLAAYEDTGLEPEEIAEMKRAWNAACSAYEFNRTREEAEAELEKREADNEAD